MNHSIIIAIAIISGVSAGSTLAGPALLDFPGPGYREQAERLLPKMERKTDFSVISFEWPRLEGQQNQTFPAFDLESVKPFSEPIRLFDLKGSGAASKSPQPAPKQ